MSCEDISGIFSLGAAYGVVVMLFLFWMASKK